MKLRPNISLQDQTYTNWKRADLSGKDLSGKVFVCANLTKANLSGCDLTGADFTGAILKDANLSGVTLDNTFLNSADLTGAEWKDVVANIQGFHMRGAKLRFADICPTQISGGHECHELVVALLLKEFPHDFEIQQICECIIARFIDCWHGLVKRIRHQYPHRMKDIVDTWNKYPKWGLVPRWELATVMADCKTVEDWKALRGTQYEEDYPALVRGWVMKEVERLSRGIQN